MANIKNNFNVHRILSKEYLAKFLIYKNKDIAGNLLSEQSTVVIPVANNHDNYDYNIKKYTSIKNAEVYKIITGHNGLVGYMLISTDPLNPKIDIVWRGTYDQASASINLQADSAGDASYKEASKRIILQINAAVEYLTSQTEQPITISISGHSLGGALAQYCLTDIMQALVQNNCLDNIKDNPHARYKEEYIKNIQELAINDKFAVQDITHLNLNNIHKLELGAFNSTGVSEAVYNDAHYYSEYLQNNFYAGKKHRFSINADYVINSRDGVQQTGKKNILVNCPFTDVYLFKYNPPRNICKQLLSSAAAGITANNFTGNIMSLVVGGFAYMAIGTLDSHGQQLGDLSLLNDNNFKIYSNKLPNKRRDRNGLAKITEQLLTNKSTLANNNVINTFSDSLYFLYTTITGSQVNPDADYLSELQVEKIQQQANNLKLQKVLRIAG